MKDTDKVTLTISQLKKLVKESKHIKEAAGVSNKIRVASYSSLMKRAGEFDHVSTFRKNFLELWFENVTLYWKVNAPSPGDLIAIDDGSTIYLNIEPFDGSVDKALKEFRHLDGATHSYDPVGTKNIGIIKW